MCALYPGQFCGTAAATALPAAAIPKMPPHELHATTTLTFNLNNLMRKKLPNM
jgi:hypothetical protein